MPTVSSFQAAWSVSSRAWLMAIRAPASRSRLPPRLAIGLPNATRLVERSQASSSAFSASADERMQWWMRPGPSRPWAISKPRPGPAITFAARAGARRSKLTSPCPCGSSYSPNTGEHPLDPDARGVEGHQHHRVLAVPVRLGVGAAHEDGRPCSRGGRPGRPPLAAVEDDLVALDDRGGLHVRGVRGGDLGLGHAERGADPAVEQRLEPLLLLLLGAVGEQHLHVAGVRGVAVEDQGRQRRAAHLLGDAGVVGVRESGAAVGAEPGGIRVAVARGQEEVPQALGAALPLRSSIAGGRRPGVLARGPARGDLAQDAGLDRLDLGVDEGADPSARSAARGDGAKSMSLTLDRC